MGCILVHFLKTCCVRAFAGSATLQRGFWSRAPARRSQDNAQALLWRCTKTPVKYCPCPPGGGRLGWGVEAGTDSESHAWLHPHPCPPFEGEGFIRC